MIGISTKTLYAVAALNELGTAPYPKLMKIKEIAEGAKISQNFLEQILLELKKSGLLQSIKGAQGGYRLAKPLCEILLKDVITILEHEAFENPCKKEFGALKLFWEEVNTEAQKCFSIPLSRLELCQQRSYQTLNFTI